MIFLALHIREYFLTETLKCLGFGLQAERISPCMCMRLWMRVLGGLADTVNLGPFSRNKMKHNRCQNTISHKTHVKDIPCQLLLEQRLESKPAKVMWGARGPIKSRRVPGACGVPTTT